MNSEDRREQDRADCFSFPLNDPLGAGSVQDLGQESPGVGVGICSDFFG